MKTRLSALLITSIAGLALSGPVLADPKVMDGDFFMLAARDDQAERSYRKQGQREMRRENRRHEKNDGNAGNGQQDRGYGYGYERRYPQPRKDGDGRR